MKFFYFLLLFAGLGVISTACQSNKNKAVQVGDNAFIHDNKVYKIIDNQITLLQDMDKDTIAKSSILEPKMKMFERDTLNFIKEGARAGLVGVYRGDQFYFTLRINGFDNLREDYRGSLTINLKDQYGFNLHSIEAGVGDFVRVVNDKGQTRYFSYDGTTQMNSHIFRAIDDYGISSSLQKSAY